MSFNISCYQNVIRERIRNGLIYDDESPDDYSVVAKRAALITLIERGACSIADIEKYKKELVEKPNNVRETDGSKGQFEVYRNMQISYLNDLIKVLMEIPRIKSLEEIKG